MPEENLNNRYLQNNKYVELSGLKSMEFNFVVEVKLVFSLLHLN